MKKEIQTNAPVQVGGKYFKEDKQKMKDRKKERQKRANDNRNNRTVLF